MARARARARRAAVSRTASARGARRAALALAGRSPLWRPSPRSCRSARQERGLGSRTGGASAMSRSRARTVRATAARQPRKSCGHACLELARTSDTRAACCARTLRATPQTCSNDARRFGQIDGETSARRMIGDGSSHAPTARSERGAPSERTSSRTRRRAHGLLTRTMPPAVPRSHYLPAWSGSRPRKSACRNILLRADR